MNFVYTVCGTVFDDNLFQNKVRTTYGISGKISGKVMSVKIHRLTIENKVIFVGKKIKSKFSRPAIRM